MKGIVKLTIVDKFQFDLNERTENVMTAEQMWKDYCEKENIDINTEYEAWQFGAAANNLAALVMIGAKTATASSYERYQLEDEPAPEVGEYSVILDANEEALCIIKDIKVEAIPYKEVSSEQAYKEGEGDRTLEYWRSVHWPFFQEEHEECGVPFTEESRVLCEEFELVHSLYEVKEVSDEMAREIVGWKYDGDYAIYNMPAWEECEKLNWSIVSAQKRHNQYYAVCKAGEFLGFFHIMERDEMVELGVGIKPELCGQHNGGMLMELALAKIEEKYSSMMVQLKVRPFNTRAIKCYENVGFKTIGSYYEDEFVTPGEMLIMHKMIN